MFYIDIIFSCWNFKVVHSPHRSMNHDYQISVFEIKNNYLCLYFISGLMSTINENLSRAHMHWTIKRWIFILGYKAEINISESESESVSYIWIKFKYW